MTSQELPRKAKRSVACRECQRLKLKCNRSWPCESCLKRGVADICPEGVLPTTRQQRSKLIDTSRLHERNVQMANRIRQLEDALATMQFNVSTEPHPLLSDHLSSLGIPLERPPLIEGITLNTAPINSLEETIESFGTLSIGANGRTVFHSQAVSADYLAEPPSNTTLRNRSIAEAMSLPSAIISLGALFPFGDARAPLDNLKHDILLFLPSPERARSLADNYFHHFSWWYNPIPREQFDQEIFPILGSPAEVISADRLSVFFMVLAMSTIVDVEGDLELTVADSYWQLSRAAFVLEPLLDVSTTYTIQALQLMVAYLHITNRQKVEHQWVILGLISRLVQSSGLHFDAAHWIKDAQIVERRRRIFYEALSFDVVLSFTMGRPPAFALAHIQCKLPADDEKIEVLGMEQCGFSNWKYRFTKECLLPLMDEAFGARPPSYYTILRLDRKLREFPVPRHLVYTGLAGNSEESDTDRIPLHICLQRAFVLLVKESSLISLHRIYYAHALVEQPGNPFSGKYAASVLATFRSASRIIAGCQDVSSRYMTLASRNWWIWQKVSTAGMVLAMLISRSPRCKLAHSALIALRLATNMLQHRTEACRSADSRRLLETFCRHAEEAFDSGKPAATSCEQGLLDNDARVMFSAVVPREGCQSLADAPYVEQSIGPQVEQRRVEQPEQHSDSMPSWQHAHPDLTQFWARAGIMGNSVDEKGAPGYDTTLAPPIGISDLNAFQSSGDDQAEWERIQQITSSMS